MEEKSKKTPFTRVPHVTLERLARVRLKPNEWRTVMALMRKTYGYHKSKDRISLSQFEKMTGMDRKRQSSALKSLRGKRIFAMKPGPINTYALNWKGDGWLVAGSPLDMTPEDKDRLVALRSKPVAFVEELPVAGVPHTIDNTIDNHTIDKLQESKDSQSFVVDGTFLADAHPQKITLSDNAFACAPAETEDESMPSVRDEGVKTEHPYAGPSEQVMTIDIIAPPVEARLRSIHEIRKEHPDAIRNPFGVEPGRWSASWRDSSATLGYRSERCL